MADPLNFEACTESLCLSPPHHHDFGLCIPGREVNHVPACRGLSTTHCRAPLHPGRIGRLFIKCPESGLINFKDGTKGQILTMEKLSVFPFLLFKGI